MVSHIKKENQAKYNTKHGHKKRSSHRGAVEMNPTRNHEVVGSIPGLVQWVGTQCCYELPCRLQMQLRSHVAVPVA